MANNRIKSKKENGFLAIGLGLSFIFLLFGINTHYIPYTLIAIGIAAITIYIYEQ